jgi:hypothetical protein
METAVSHDYSALDRMFHRLVLGNRVMGEMLGDLEAMACKDMTTASDPVFVTGLARAGSTVLMRLLHETGQFSALTYADMPMVMAPNLWAGLSARARKKSAARERAHGDGVLVDVRSPEALEEVFWRTYCGDTYITPDGLVPHIPDAETLDMFRTYQSRVCHCHKAPRYLAKNNNMMLRLGPVAKAMPDARILVPVRHPVAQAVSLQRQHQRFANADPFTRNYMRWLVHHEFGADQRPFRLPGQPCPEGSRTRLDYWLTTWVACYGWLEQILEDGAPNIRPVIYETLDEGSGIWPALAAFLSIPPVQPAGFRPAPVPAVPAETSADLLDQALTLYKRFRRRVQEVW